MDKIEFQTATSVYELEETNNYGLLKLTKKSVVTGESAVKPGRCFFAVSSEIYIYLDMLFFGDMHTSRLKEPKKVAKWLTEYDSAHKKEANR